MGLPQERDRIYADGLGRVDVKLPKEKQSVTKYSEKLSEREVRKSGNDSFFEKWQISHQTIGVKLVRV